MQIDNLDINILYLLWTSCGSGRDGDFITGRDLSAEFADIQREDLQSAVAALRSGGMIRIDDACSRLSITRKGLDWLQSRAAFEVHDLDRCRLPG